MRYFIYIICIMFSFFSISQNRCSFDEYRESLKDRGLYRDAPAAGKIVHFQNSYTIPVVVHVLYNNDEENISDERIYSQIETLNNDYNANNLELDNLPTEFLDVLGNVGISFCLVQTDLNGNQFSGINRVYTDVESFQGFDDAMKNTNQGGIDAWDTSKYLNIWVCNLLGNTLGFATMPGSVDAELDGVVIDYQHFGVDSSFENPYNLGRTATHEVGHYLNLEHTFYAGCSDWDGCDDTPAISSPTYGCPDYPQMSCQLNSMTMNYMDYADDACMYMFTICQAEIMVSALLNLRSDLLLSLSSYDCTVSIQENASSINYIFPNPVNDWLVIPMDNVFISILDIYGKEVYSKYIQSEELLNISSLKKGCYIVRCGNKNYNFIKI